MVVELKVPAGSESITEVTVGDWTVKVGDFVEEDDALVELETDKASQPLIAPASGRVIEILVESGDDATPGQVLAKLDETATAPEDGGDDDSPAPAASESPQNSAPVADSEPVPEGESFVMPAAARLMAEHDIDEADVKGSGPGGRILKEDVQKVIAKTDAQPIAPLARHTESRSMVEPLAEPSIGDEEVVRMSRIRQVIAKRLTDAQQTAALLTTFNEIDMTEVMALRKQYQETFVKKYDIKLGFMSFFVKATIDALKAFPAINAEIRGRDIVYKNYYHIGIAVGGPKGLVVPVLRNADHLSFSETELAIKEYAIRANKSDLRPEELTGGTFTISNGGVYGSLLSTPIVNPPQSGVLGMHSIQQRAMVMPDGSIQARPMMYVALTYDHRIVDGKEGVSFLMHIKNCVEDPTRLLLEV